MRSRALIGLMLVMLVAWASPALVAGRHVTLHDEPAATAAAPTPTIIAIAAGPQHTCALNEDGGVKCWGFNDAGPLGTGTTTDSLIPVDVSGLSRSVTAIAAGHNRTCALTSGGGVKCWGSNAFGGLGDGATTNSLIPVDVSGLTSGVTAISAGNLHTCALHEGGMVTCWGYNSQGQLGDGTTTDSLTPVTVSGLTSGVEAISAGYNRTCAITSDDGVKCWGANEAGQLGDGTTTDSLIPVDVLGLTSGVSAISAAGTSHSCALSSDGGVTCWGSNGSGQLGDGPIDGGPTTDSLLPVDVFYRGVTAIATGGGYSCALTGGGGVKCWGANEAGQLGYGKPTDFGIPYPIDVEGLSSGVSAIAAGLNHTCAIANGGGVKCWGSNVYGTLGDGTTMNSSVPVDVVFAPQGLPQTDTADSRANEGRADPPVLPLLAGLAAGIATLVRRHPREADHRLASTGGV